MTDEEFVKLENARKARQLRKDILASKRHRIVRTPRKNRQLKKETLIQNNLLSQTVSTSAATTKPSRKKTINAIYLEPGQPSNNDKLELQRRARKRRRLKLDRMRQRKTQLDRIQQTQTENIDDSGVGPDIAIVDSIIFDQNSDSESDEEYPFTEWIYQSMILDRQ